MIKTPLGNIKVQENPDRDNPGIEILVTLPDGTEDRIALVEYQKEYNTIATYTYKEEEEDFTSKTIYKASEMSYGNYDF